MFYRSCRSELCEDVNTPDGTSQRGRYECFDQPAAVGKVKIGLRKIKQIQALAVGGETALRHIDDPRSPFQTPGASVPLPAQERRIPSESDRELRHEG